MSSATISVGSQAQRSHKPREIRALRRHDLRDLQSRLASLGLSSLGRSEARILESVNTVRTVLKALDGDVATEWDEVGDQAAARNLLTEHANALLGAAPPHRSVRIMVTMPSEAADDYTLVHALVKAGMDCMRINCAHDDRHAWTRMIEHLRRATEALNRPCQVAMDVAGPKLRTGPLQPGPAVVKIRPERDVFGRVIAPARVWLTDDREGRASPASAHATLPVSSAWLHGLRYAALLSRHGRECGDRCDRDAAVERECGDPEMW